MPQPGHDEGLRSRAVRGAAWSVTEALGARIITTVVFVLLARMLDPEAFGLVALALVFIALTRLFVDQGFGAAIVQRQDLGKAHLDTAFWTSVVLGLLLGGVLFAVSAPLADALGSPELAPVLQALSSVVFIGSLTSTPTAVLRRNFQFQRLASRKLLGAVVGGVVGVVAAMLGAGVWALVAQAVVQTAVSTVVLWMVSPYRPGFTVSRTAFKELFAYSNSVIGITLLNFLSKRSDDLLIGTVLGPTALGLYLVAFRLLNIMTEVLTRAVEMVALSAFSRLQHDLTRLGRAYAEAVRTCAAMTAPSYLLVLVLAPDIVAVFFGAQWEEAVPVMQALSLAGMAHALGATTTTLLLAVNRTRTALYLTTATTVLNVVGFLIAVSWGIVAVALAHTVRAFIMVPVSAALAKAILGFSWRTWLGHLAPATGSALFMAVVVELLRRYALVDLDPLGRLAVLVPVALLLYAVLLRLVSPSQFRALVKNGQAIMRRRAPAGLQPEVAGDPAGRLREEGHSAPTAAARIGTAGETSGPGPAGPAAGQGPDGRPEAQTGKDDAQTGKDKVPR